LVFLIRDHPRKSAVSFPVFPIASDVRGPQAAPVLRGLGWDVGDRGVSGDRPDPL
jgi:hypothetical protein